MIERMQAGLLRLSELQSELRWRDIIQRNSLSFLARLTIM